MLVLYRDVLSGKVRQCCDLRARHHNGNPVIVVVWRCRLGGRGLARVGSCGLDGRSGVETPPVAAREQLAGVTCSAGGVTAATCAPAVVASEATAEASGEGEAATIVGAGSELTAVSLAGFGLAIFAGDDGAARFAIRRAAGFEPSRCTAAAWRTAPRAERSGSRVRASRAGIPKVRIPQARNAEPRTTLSAATTPDKSGTRYCTAIRQHRRYRAHPTDELAKAQRNQAITGQSALSSSST